MFDEAMFDKEMPTEGIELLERDVATMKKIYAAAKRLFNGFIPDVFKRDSQAMILCFRSTDL